MARTQGAHEDYGPRSAVTAGSERSFGVVFAAVAALVGLWPLPGGGGPRYWALGIAAALLVVVAVRPGLLRPFNLLWFKFGLLLHAVVNPLVMGILFFGVVLPTALLMRLFGKDPLRLRIDRRAPSYWIPREPPGPEPGSLKNQF